MKSDEAWTWAGGAGVAYRSEHYLLRTTLTDREVVSRFANTLEDAHAKYRQLVPSIRRSDRPLTLYLFATYDEWAAYTAATAGPDAAVYLQIYAGGYTVRDRFVCWLGNEPDTLSLACHEGFHQFVGRHFSDRLPPALEEGLATTFETLNPGAHGSTVDPAHNPRREAALKAAVEGDYLIPLPTLVRLHAGDLIDRPVELREAFYAQCWALAVYLRDDPRLAGRLENWLDLAAAGKARPLIGGAAGTSEYYPERIAPWFENAFGRPLSELETDYTQFVKSAVLRNSE